MVWRCAETDAPPLERTLFLAWRPYADDSITYTTGFFRMRGGNVEAVAEAGAQTQYLGITDSYWDYRVFWMEIPPHPDTAQLKKRSQASRREFLKSMLAQQEKDAEETRRQLAEVR